MCNRHLTPLHIFLRSLQHVPTARVVRTLTRSCDETAAVLLPSRGRLVTLAQHRSPIADGDWFGTAATALPVDADDSVLIGRIWNPVHNGPSPVPRARR